jgi:hypothetical protein
MKKYLLPLALGVLLAQTAIAQVTLERSYAVQRRTGLPLVSVAKMSTGELKYYFGRVDSSSATPTYWLQVYNEDHSLYRAIALSGDFEAGSVRLLSDKLFDGDAGLEYTAYGPNGVVVYNEDHTVLATMDSANYLSSAASVNQASIVTGATGTKLLLGYYRPGSWLWGVRVYALPGTYVQALAVPDAAGDALARPYPNPATGFVRLPYRLATGVATLTVSDATGRVIREVNVDATFDDFLLNTAGLAPGTYFYRVGEAAAQRFVVAN